MHVRCGPPANNLLHKHKLKWISSLGAEQDMSIPPRLSEARTTPADTLDVHWI